MKVNMKLLGTALVLVSALAANIKVSLDDLDVLPIDDASHKDAVPNQYVVIFKKDVTDELMAHHYSNVPEENIMYKYDFGAQKNKFRGYAVKGEPESDLLMFIRGHKEAVHYVEQNKIMRANNLRHPSADTFQRHVRAAENAGAMVRLNKDKPVRKAMSPNPANQLSRAARRLQTDCALQLEATWGLVRTTTETNSNDGLYHYKDNDGEGVRAYIIDTGIYIEHEDFEGRAYWGHDAVDSPSSQTDENGHGTHVAGTVGSKSWGIAKKVTLIAVKVLGANGSGTTAGVISGINWAANDHSDTSVSNMSLGGGYSSSLNQACNAAHDDNLLMVVAAGNESDDSCDYSPASADKAFSVMCSDSGDRFCYFSNYGECSDIIAPGMSITSTWIGSKYADNTISGTSMSAPHICGIAAKLMSRSGTALSVDSLKTEVLKFANPDRISNTGGWPSKTANELSYLPCV